MEGRDGIADARTERNVRTREVADPVDDGIGMGQRLADHGGHVGGQMLAIGIDMDGARSIGPELHRPLHARLDRRALTPVLAVADDGDAQGLERVVDRRERGPRAIIDDDDALEALGYEAFHSLFEMLVRIERRNYDGMLEHGSDLAVCGFPRGETYQALASFSVSGRMSSPSA